jgi:hypothetical protein
MRSDCPKSTWKEQVAAYSRRAMQEWGFTTGNDRGQADAALVRRFRQAVRKRDRAAVFDAVVREHRDAVLARCTERLWPDADAAVAAAHDLLVVAYLAMADPAKLARPELLRDWLLGIADFGQLAPGLPVPLDAVNWAALHTSITGYVPDQPDMRGAAARHASLRRWLEQIVATLPEPRQQMYDLFVRRAANSRIAATELGTDVAETWRLRRENREAILRAFEVTALAAAEAGCGALWQMLADAQRDGGTYEGVRRDNVVLPADLRLAVTRHASQCEACRERRAACMAQWAPDLLPLLAGAELNEQVIEDLRAIPEPGWWSRAAAPAHGRHRGDRGGRAGPVAVGKAIAGRRASVAGAGLLMVLMVLGFAEPGFFLSTAASAPRSSSASSQDTSIGRLSSGGTPQIAGTSAEASARPVAGAATGSSRVLPPIPGVTSAAPTSPFATPTQPSQDVLQPSSSPTSPSAQPTTASPTATPTSSTPAVSPSASATKPSPVVSTTQPSSPTPTPTSTSPTPTPTPSTSATSATPTSTPSSTPASSTPASSTPAPSTPAPSSLAPSASAGS